jgi:hypothetical protein
LAFQILSKATTVQTFEARSDADGPLDWEPLGLPILRDAFEARRAEWRTQFQVGQFVIPTFHRRGFRPKNRPGLADAHAPQSSGYWCGGLTTPAPEDRMEWVEGQWTVPFVSLPANGMANQTYILSTWVGMDGDFGAPDVLQAGCDATVGYFAGTLQYKYQPWWQWYPGKSWTINAVAMAPGDVISCKIALNPGTASAATIVFSNLTSGQHTAFAVITPAVTVALLGRCAEWIGEAFGSLGPMAGFQPVTFDGCYSGTMNGQTISSGQGTTVQMVNSNQQVLASAGQTGPASIQIA